MANSKKSLPSNRSGSATPHPLVTHLHTFLKNRLKPQQRLLLALSGGLDSVVLLHLLAQTRHQLDFELLALHVHHGLSPHADIWAQFCLDACVRLNVPCKVSHVAVPRDSGLGVEQAARQLRYEALFDFQMEHAKPDYIVTAHHQDDQAETLLLQLFRGAGIKGLAAMGANDDARRLLRPLLTVSHEALQNYAMEHGIRWCEDESNQDTQYERNFVRHEVMPVLRSRYPAIHSTIARTAGHIAQASELLDVLAEMDIQPLLDSGSMSLSGLAQLTPARAKNGLRWWLNQHGMAMPSADQLQEILNQLLDAKADAKLAIQVHTQDLNQVRTIKRYQQRAYLIDDIQIGPYDLLWQGEPEIALPHGGKLTFRQLQGAGLATKLDLSKLRVTNRKGGERFKPNANKPTRTLKHLLQEANMPPWLREQLPLIYWQDTLAYVPGIGIAHELQAGADEAGLGIDWRPD
jgi:tRNA(Ile)-lysidine synthase